MHYIRQKLNEEKARKEQQAKQGTAHCLNPATGKWELPTHYLAYNETTATWSEPIRAEAASTLAAETILIPVLTGREYGEQTTAGALAAWLSRKTEIPETPARKTLGDILNTPIGEILSNPRPHPIGELIHGTEEPSPISITADTTYYLHDAATDTWSAAIYTLSELMRLPDTSASTLIRPAGSEATITLAQARQHWKADGMEETSTGKTPTAQQSARQSQKETDHLNQLPSEIRAADYLLRHTQLADTIAAAKDFFQKAAAFITFVLILNIAAIIILLIAFMVSASK